MQQWVHGMPLPHDEMIRWTVCIYFELCSFLLLYIIAAAVVVVFVVRSSRWWSGVAGGLVPSDGNSSGSSSPLFFFSLFFYGERTRGDLPYCTAWLWYRRVCVVYKYIHGRHHRIVSRMRSNWNFLGDWLVAPLARTTTTTTPATTTTTTLYDNKTRAGVKLSSRNNTLMRSKEKDATVFRTDDGSCSIPESGKRHCISGHDRSSRIYFSYYFVLRREHERRLEI